MFRKVTAVIRHAFDVLWYGLLVLRYAGLRTMLQKIIHQVYAKTTFLVVKRSLDILYPPSSFRGVLSVASQTDIREFFSLINKEDREFRYQLLIRKWYHQKGVGTAYVLRDADTSELCHIRWFVTKADIEKSGFTDRYLELKEDEVVIENSYTLEKYRGKGVQHTCAKLGDEVLRQQGFRWGIGYIADDNLPSLRSAKIRDNMVFAKTLERHTLFRVNRKTLERYDPPIPITVP